jgi:hypothetical protein
MEKPKYIPIIDHSKPKKTPTNFVRATKANSADKKSKSPGNMTNKPQGWIKKQDETWDY